LPERKVQVTQFTAAGTTTEEVALALCRSSGTVRIHARQILGKTQAPD